jgi:hypothetical protein
MESPIHKGAEKTMMRRVGVLGAVGVVAILGSVSSVSAQQIGGWVSANATMDKPATDTTTQAVVFPYRLETFQSTQVYTQKNKPSFDIDGGVRFGSFGAGLAVSRYSDNETVFSHLSVPSRFTFGNLATASANTQNPLGHEETALHFEGRYIANLPRMSVAVFAGPSYIKTRQDLVTDNTYQEIDSLTLHTVQITNYDFRTADLHAWGYNVGVDWAYYFSTFLGVGGLVRFSQATVQLPNDLQTTADGHAVTQDLKVGGLNFGGGVRVRF